MSKTISPADTAVLMASDGLFAVFDVRERGEYNDEQIPNTTSLPRSQIELRIADLVPNRKIAIVVYEEGGQRAELAAATLAELGYEDVSVLQGGFNVWRAERRETVSGVNVPSKAFGERVHHQRAVPDLSPEELKALIDGQEDLTILDMRTPEEYGRFCIPGGINVPGGELIHWADELRNKPAVIVNCAGRTRSIIGAAALRRLGLTNVRALRNGTMGWVLAGFQLETMPSRIGARPATAAQAQATAERIAAEENISSTPPEEVARLDDGAGVHYLIDVRSVAEFAAGHIAGSINVPGGQAVQRADDFVPVRNGEIIFISDHGAQAVMAAYWYRQMGFKHASVLQGGLTGWRAGGRQVSNSSTAAESLGIGMARRALRFIGAAELFILGATTSSLIVDVSTSLEHESGHVPGAKWISRGWLDVKIPELFPDRGARIVLTCADGRQSIFAARQLARVGYTNVLVLDGGLKSWVAAGFATASGLTDCLVTANDVVLSPSIRGSKQDMLNYLNWELKLKH